MLMQNPEFRLYAICSVILAFEMMILAGLSGGRRVGSKKFVNPEDAKTSAGEIVTVDPPEVARARRVHLNAVENIPLFFALGLVYVLAGASPLGAKICFITFTAMRVLHAIFYSFGKQPWRTLTYAIGSVCLAAMGGMTLVAVLNAG